MGSRLCQFDGLLARNAVDVDSDNADRPDESGDFSLGINARTVFVTQQSQRRDLFICRFHEMGCPERYHTAEI